MNVPETPRIRGGPGRSLKCYLCEKRYAASAVISAGGIGRPNR